MKHFLLILTSFVALNVCGQLSQIVVEEYTMTAAFTVQPPGTTTYRIYAEMASSTDKITAVFASLGCHPLNISTTTSFFNDGFGSVLGADANSAFFQFFPTYEADSWITIGADNNQIPGAANVAAVATVPENPYTESIGTVEEGQSLVMDDGVWYTLPTSPTSLPVGENNRILLGQFTTSGVLTFALNIQAFLNGDIENGRVDYVWNYDCIGDPITSPTGYEQWFPGLYSGLECADENACNYSSLSTTNDDCLYISGCMDPEFCSYNPNACIDSGCDENVYGCLEPNAINYNPDATCSKPCNYEITGMVFHDQNQNGIQDEGEPLIPNQEFNFLGTSQMSFFSDNSGLFSIELQSGLYWLSMPDNPAFPFITSHTFPFSFYSSELSTLNIGLDFELPEINLDVNISPVFGSLICTSISPVYVFTNNSSNVDITGYIELEFDDQLYAPGQFQYIDSVVGNKVYQSFGTFPLWSLAFNSFQFTAIAPIAEGTTTFLNAKVYAYYGDQFIGIYEDSWEAPVLCSYDPNDITVSPPGWNVPHFIDQEETLEYRIRFQNTGNFQAFNVVLRDTISEHLDLSTFELKAASHNVETMINHETRELVFTFNDINLPYEECCGEESIGQVIYEIQAYENLPANTPIENTAYIYFDNNEPIVTNTAFSTIYVCPENLAEFTADVETLCLGNALNVEATQPWVETYSWTVNNAPNGSEQLNSIDFTEAGIYSIHLTASNPFCSHSSAVDVEVLPLPTASFAENNNVLTATESAAYQWYVNGILIDGATNQTYEITEDGNYSMEATGDNGCVAMSDEVFVAYVGINEQWKDNLSVYPIPVNKNDVLNIAGVNLAAITQIRIIDRAGKVVFESSNGLRQIPIGNWASGNYTLEIYSGGDKVVKQVVVR